jgi:hypothetical protein
LVKAALQYLYKASRDCDGTFQVEMKVTGRNSLLGSCGIFKERDGQETIFRNAEEVMDLIECRLGA